MKPLCFVIMPFGIKKYKDATKKEDEWITIDFDEVYKKIILPAIVDADMDPIRADEEKMQGSIHKPMFERIILSDYVVADLTGANANVFYELGIRHAVKPHTTVSIFASNSELPFDLKPFRTYPYSYTKENGLENIDSIKKIITENLLAAKSDKYTDSPVYQLVDGFKFQNNLDKNKIDIFRARVKYNEQLTDELAEVRTSGADQSSKIAAIKLFIANNMARLEDQEVALLVDVMLSYRDISAYKEMEEFIGLMPEHVKRTILVQEQYGLVLNRNGKRKEAIKVLKNAIKENGPSSETYGILGRVYKDYIKDHYDKDEIDMAFSYLNDTIEAYKNGFEADWRDAYPGINYVTCLELKGEMETIAEILPVVEYSVLRKKENKEPDYWDEATLAEIGVIEKDYDKAKKYLVEAKKHGPSKMNIDTTRNNFKMIRKFRARRDEDTSELDAIIQSMI